MGVNISVRKLISTEIEDTWSNTKKCFYYTEDQEWWDYTRHSGDREFAVQCLHRYADELDEDSGLLRPNNFDKAIKWVEDNIDPQGNRNRLINALKEMEKDNSLYFKISW